MTWTKKIRPLLPVVGIVFLLAILFSVDRDKILALLSKADPFFLLFALAVNAIVIAIKGAKWKTFFFEKKKQVTLSECVQGYLKGFFLSSITPGRIGDFARALFVKEKVGFSFAMASVLLDRISDIALLLALSFFSLVGFFYIKKQWIVNPLLVLGLLIVMLAGVLYVLRKNNKGFFRSFLFAITPDQYRQKIQETYGQIIQELQTAKKKPKAILEAVVQGIAAWFFSAWVGFLVAGAIGIHQPFYFFGITVLLLSLLEIIPITVAGLGTREAGAIFLFSAVGLSSETAVAYSLLFFFTAIIPTSILGGLLFIRKPTQA